MATQEQLSEVVDALSAVQDPCSLRTATPIDIARFGLLEDVSITEEGDVSIRVMLTEPSCFFTSAIVDAAEKAVLRVPWVKNVSVDLDVTEIWTPDRITEDLRSVVMSLE